ncbi:hypothetical protein BKA62DRAFT_402694 [Auriculariales sp. MPI-PUGE-AT-0066]|nr:hypothetical protein BKA62DRAFT_402694 [Auriculariales sp. MPI-PUGE-AT-0066]
MNSSVPSGDSASSGSARGRGRSRGGVGKFLRARGRRGPALRADFSRRATGDTDDEDLDSEEERLERAKYARRAMASNADRYEEPEPDPHAEPNAEGELEPEIYLVSLTKKQLEIAAREDAHLAESSITPVVDDEEVDASILAKTRPSARQTTFNSDANSRKGKAVVVAWDAELDEMARDKAEAEALSDLKARLKKQANAPKSSTTTRKLKVAPPLQSDTQAKTGTQESMQGFLDDLLG